jgi:mitochondrial fission protein ELM1
MRSVQLGNPRASPGHFDLVITTPQYPVADAPNVVRIPIAISRAFDHPPPAPATEAFLASLPSPRRLLLIGGPTSFWMLDPADVTEAIARLLADCRAKGGSLLVLGSPRTPGGIMTAAAAALANAPAPAAIVPIEGPPSYAELRGAADLLFVTADSVAMTSEAVMTGKPVGLVPVRLRKTAKARFARHDRRHPGKPIHPRDLRCFWAELKRRGLVGTVEEPASGADPEVNLTAVALVRRLLAPPATDGRDSAPSGSGNPVAHSQG